MATATTKAPKKAPAKKAAETEFSGTYHYAVGKRKTAIARVKLYKGKGIFVVNGKTAKEYFSLGYDAFTAPFTVAELSQKDYDLSVKIVGGGPNAQAEAARHGISRALELMTEELRSPLKRAGFLTRDARVKERKKPGLKRARRSPQWAKR